jgi:hypothetical protein
LNIKASLDRRKVPGVDAVVGGYVHIGAVAALIIEVWCSCDRNLSEHMTWCAAGYPPLPDEPPLRT